MNTKKLITAASALALSALLISVSAGTAQTVTAQATMAATMADTSAASGTMAATMAGTQAVVVPYCTPAIAAKMAGKYIPVVSKGFSAVFWQDVAKGAAQAAKDCGVTTNFEGPDTEAQIDQQINMLQTELNKNPAAIIFAALDTKAALPLLQQAQTAKIPVIAFDSGVASDIPLTTAATDNLAAAALAADKMAGLIGNSGEIALVVHDQTSQTGIDRRDGFVNEIKAKYPNITIDDIEYSAADALKATDETKAILQAHPAIKGIFGSNEPSAIGVVNGVKEAGMVGKIVIVGYDSGQDQIDAINNGTEAGAITQDPIGIGYKAVEAAVKALNGETLPKTIDTGFHWYDKTNINDPAIAALLYK